MELNTKAWGEIVGPFLSKMLGDKSYFYGDEFSALDVIVGFSILGVGLRIPGGLEKFPNLEAFAGKAMERPSMELVMG